MLIFNVPQSDEGPDYELLEVKRSLSVLEEIGTKHLFKYGCDVRPTDIKRGYRIWQWKGKEDLKPIKVEFKTLEKAMQVAASVRVAGFLERRVLTTHGRYRHTGKLSTDKIERARMPKTFINVSTTKAYRDTIKAQKEFKDSNVFLRRVSDHSLEKKKELDYSKFRMTKDGDVTLIDAPPPSLPPASLAGLEQKPWQLPDSPRRPQRARAARATAAAAALAASTALCDAGDVAGQ